MAQTAVLSTYYCTLYLRSIVAAAIVGTAAIVGKLGYNAELNLAEGYQTTRAVKRSKWNCFHFIGKVKQPCENQSSPDKDPPVC